MKSSDLAVTEIFYSIQGEGAFAGWPCVFVRLTGCNCRCVWCDTTYSFYGKNKMSISEILLEVNQFKNSPMVEITGGEPLLQKNVYTLIDFLLKNKKTVAIETSGTISIEKIPIDVHIVMDLKAPGSGEESKNNFQNLNLLKKNDDLKFVVKDDLDIEWVNSIYDKYNLKDKFIRPPILQPVFGAYPLKQLAQKILQNHRIFRYGLQLHKFIWEPTEQGV